MGKIKKRKKPTTFLTGLIAFGMAASCFYTPTDNLVEAATVGQSRTFANTNTGNIGANVDKSTGTLGTSPSFGSYTGYYHWVVPETGVYTIEAKGAQGGYSENGRGSGAIIKGDFTFEKGTVLIMLVGQAGQDRSGDYDSGGGGGTFVTKQVSSSSYKLSSYNIYVQPLIIAGGAGGDASDGSGANGSIDEASTGLYPNTNYGYGGMDTQGTNGPGGGGFLTAGDNGASNYAGAGGSAFLTSGIGGQGNHSWGGFGSGAGGMDEQGAGGGGYTGGNGQDNNVQGNGGGGSYNIGQNKSATTGNFAQGQVTITFVKPTMTLQSPANNTKFQNSYIDVFWSNDGHAKYEIQAGTTPGGNNILALTNKGIATSHRLTVPAGIPGNTMIYWRVRGVDDGGNVGDWREQTVIYSNNVPTITATPNTPANLDVGLEKRNHTFKINGLKDPDDFNYVTLFADVLDKNGNVVSGSKKQIVLDSSLVSSASLISGTSTEKDGSLQGPFDYKTAFNLKLSLQPNFTNSTFDLTLTKADGTTNIIKSGQKIITGRSMQASSATAAENYTLRIYPEDRQNTNGLSASPLAGVNDVTAFSIPFTVDTRNYLPRITNVKHDVAKRIFSDSEGFNRISVTGHVDDSDIADKVTMYYEVQPKATKYSIQVKTVSGKVVPKNGTATQTFDPKVDNDFALTYQIDSNLDSGNYALLVYGYDTQEGLGDYVEIPFSVERGNPTIDFTSDYKLPSGKIITMAADEREIVAEDSKVKLYFTPNNYATFEYAGYLIRGGAVKDLRIRGAFTNVVKTSFIGVDLGQDPITLLDGATTDFQLGDIVVFKFKATSATGIKTTKDVRILIGNDASNFTPLDDAKLPTLP